MNEGNQVFFEDLAPCIQEVIEDLLVSIIEGKRKVRSWKFHPLSRREDSIRRPKKVQMFTCLP